MFLLQGVRVYSIFLQGVRVRLQYVFNLQVCKSTPTVFFTCKCVRVHTDSMFLLAMCKSTPTVFFYLQV